MPRRQRNATAGFVFHAINRAAGGWPLFATDDDYCAFLKVLEEGLAIAPIRILAYTLMPNHWHLVLWPATDDQLSEYLHWTTATHANRWHKAHGTQGRGALYQGRFKSFPVQEDDHYYALTRYVERNALRANLVSRAESWRWCSLWQRQQERADLSLSAWPIPFPNNWLAWVNEPQTDAELLRIRQCVQLSTPFGNFDWCGRTAKLLDLNPLPRTQGRSRRPE